jgi:hypothetical protein
MAILVSNVGLNQTFNAWLTTTNILARITSQNTVTVDASANGSLATGNSYVNGHFGSDVLYANSGLVGGSPGANGSLLVLSNTAFRQSTSNLVIITSNTSTSQVTLQTGSVSILPVNGTTIGGSTLSVNSATVNVVSDNVSIRGNTVFKANSTFNAITLTGNSTVVTLLANTTNTTIVGDTTLANRLTVTGNATFSNVVTITGPATFSNTVGVANLANVGSLFVVGTANVASNLRVGGDLIVVGNLAYSGVIAGDLVPSTTNTFSVGSTTLRWASGFILEINSTNVISTGTATLNTTAVTGTLSVAGNATFSNSINVVSSAVFSNTLVVVGNTQFSNTLTVTGNSQFASSLTVNNAIVLGTTSAVSPNNFTFTNSNTTSTVDSFQVAEIRSAEYLIQTSDTTAPANSHQITKLLLVHNGTTAFITEYATITTNATMGIFNAAISTGALNLRYTPVSNNVVVKITRTSITV